MTEISAIYEALDNMDDYALMANVKPIGPHKVLTDAIAELETLRQRVAELEMSLAETEALEISHGDRIEKLIAERNALKQQRDELLAAAEQVCHANNLTEAQIAVRVLNTTIASVKEK